MSGTGEGDGRLHVFQHGQAFQQIEALEDIADVAGSKTVQCGFLKFVQLLPSEDDRALVRTENPGNEVKQSRLADPAWADQRDSLPFLEFEGALDDRTIVRFLQILQGEKCFGTCSLHDGVNEIGLSKRWYSPSYWGLSPG